MFGKLNSEQKTENATKARSYDFNPVMLIITGIKCILKTYSLTWLEILLPWPEQWWNTNEYEIQEDNSNKTEFFLQEPTFMTAQHL